MTNSQEAHGNKKMSGWKIALMISAAVLVAGAATTWYLLWQGGMHSKLANADASWIESNNSTSSSMSSSSFNDARMEWSRIAVIDESGHAFGKRVTELLIEDLKQAPGVKEVMRDVQPDQQLPSLTIRVSLPEFTENDSLLKRNIDARIHVEMGNVPKSRAPGYSSSGDPPLMDMQWKVDLDHHSKSLGDGLGADKYRLSAKDAASQISKQIRENFEKWIKDPGELFELPPEFFGPFVPVKEVSVIVARKMKCLSSGYRMMMHNESTYEWIEAGDPREIIKRIADDIVKEGWRQTDISPREKDQVFSQVYVRMMRDDRRVTISCETQDHMKADDVTLKSRKDRYRLVYQHQFSSEEKAAAIQKLIDAGEIRKAMHFYHCMPEGQKNGMDAWIETHPTMNLRAAIDTLWRYQGNPAKAEKLLNKYNTLARLSPNDNTRSRREEEAKKLGVKLPQDYDALKETDMQEIDAIKLDGQEKIERTIEIENPLVAYRIYPDGKVKALVIQISEADPRDRKLYVAYIEGGGKSMMSTPFYEQNGKYHAEGADGNCYITADQVGRSEKILIKIVQEKKH